LIKVFQVKRPRSRHTTKLTRAVRWLAEKSLYTVYTHFFFLLIVIDPLLYPRGLVLWIALFFRSESSLAFSSSRMNFTHWSCRHVLRAQQAKQL